MLIEEPRLKLWSRDSTQSTFFVTRSAETSETFRKGVAPWMFVHDLPEAERHEESLGEVSEHTTNHVEVRICEMVWSHNATAASGQVANLVDAKGALEAAPWIWVPKPGARVIRIAWLSSVRPTHVRPAFIPKLRQLMLNEWKKTAIYDPDYPDIPNPIPSHPIDVAYPHAFPGEVNQPICLRRSFEVPQSSMRWIFAAWEEFPSLS